MSEALEMIDSCWLELHKLLAFFMEGRLFTIPCLVCRISERVSPKTKAFWMFHVDD